MGARNKGVEEEKGSFCVTRPLHDPPAGYQ